jgi:undecaprenyl phosphate-alpha-L-ara4FN deformylase
MNRRCTPRDLTLGLKVDVCTYNGLRYGVPALARLFDELHVRASFFIAFGPDHSGRAIRRLLRPGFLSKMRRTNAVSTYGWRTLFYGTLLPGPQIARSFPAQIRALAAAGHEVAVHGYDHVYWQDNLARLSDTAVAAEIARACAAYEEIMGAPPRAFGAPGWQCTAASLASEDAIDLAYHSDTRGVAPFVPQLAGQRFRTMEIPTTLPTLDETYGRVGTAPDELTAFYLRQTRRGLNVYTAHAEMEGIRQLDHLRCLLAAILERGRVLRLIDVAANLTDVPVASVQAGQIAGRAGSVALQGAPPAADVVTHGGRSLGPEARHP